MKSKLSSALCVTVFAAVAALVASGCAKATCDASNCSGCCDATNECQVSAVDHCGKGGGLCATCVASEQCLNGVCGFGGAGGNNGTGGNTGTGTTTSSSTGGSTSATTNGGSNGGTTGGTYSCSAQGSCPNDMAPTAQQIASCNTALSDPTCGSAFLADAQCAEDNATCDANGMTMVTAGACDTQQTAYVTCVESESTTGVNGGTTGQNTTGVNGGTTGQNTTGVNGGTTSTTGVNGGTTGQNTTGVNGGTTGQSTTSTNGGTTGSAYCTSAPPSPTFDNGDVFAPCTGAMDTADGGIEAVQGSCASASEYCYALFEGDVARCQVACTTPGGQDTCPGTSNVCTTLGQYSDGTDANFCLPTGTSSGVGCPSGTAAEVVSPDPNDLSVCVPKCTTAADCNGSSGANFQCVSGTCRCTNSATDCANGATCNVASGACIFPCTDNTTCDTDSTNLSSNVGCCLQYNGLDYCDVYAQ